MNLNSLFRTSGILRSELKVGVVSSVTAQGIQVNLAHAGDVSGRYIEGARYGRGEVGELLIVEGQQNISLGRLIEVRLPDRDRAELSQDFNGVSQIDAIGYVQLLGTINIEHLKIQAGISAYPRLGDRVFSAPSELISALPELMNGGVTQPNHSEITIELGEVTGETGSKIRVTPEKLFGRHCAILGSTGGGKSWTTAKIIEECAKYSNSKVIIIDATSEYRSLSIENTMHFHLGNPIHKHDESKEICIPPTDFIESDFIAMFDPAGRVQGPKLKEAIKSLRLARLNPQIFPEGYVPKIRQSKDKYRAAMKANGSAKLVDDPSQPFDTSKLIKQIQEECCQPDYDGKGKWGNEDGNAVSFCSSLFTRILGVLYSDSLKSVFQTERGVASLSDVFDTFFKCDQNVLRLCLSDVSYQFYAREVLANVIGRKLLSLARKDCFRRKPILAILDEAHNFLGKRVGAEDHSTKLDSFEIIAKEGRKYGLNICLATQRPRDITEGVLSQMGTLLVHRLTNDRDREVVERACGEIDRSAASFLPNLKQGEVALVGVDFPIPMTVQIDKPINPPKSDGPSFQKIWHKQKAKPKLFFNPIDEETFKLQLIKNKEAEIVTYQSDGSREINHWSADTFSTTSNLKNNIWSDPLRCWKDRGITKAEFSILPPTVIDQDGDDDGVRLNKAVALECQLTYDEVQNIQFEVDENVRSDGTVYGAVIQFSDGNDPEIMAKVKGLNGGFSLNIGIL